MSASGELDIKEITKSTYQKLRMVKQWKRPKFEASSNAIGEWEPSGMTDRWDNESRKGAGCKVLTEVRREDDSRRRQALLFSSARRKPRGTTDRWNYESQEGVGCWVFTEVRWGDDSCCRVVKHRRRVVKRRRRGVESSSTVTVVLCFCFCWKLKCESRTNKNN